MRDSIGLFAAAILLWAGACVTAPRDSPGPCEEATGNVAHRRRAYHCWIENRRDVKEACQGLERDGDETSVAFLIAALRLYPPVTVRGAPNVAILSTTRACLDALRAVTRHDAGAWPDDWQKWWDDRPVRRFETPDRQTGYFLFLR